MVSLQADGNIATLDPAGGQHPEDIGYTGAEHVLPAGSGGHTATTEFLQHNSDDGSGGQAPVLPSEPGDYLGPDEAYLHAAEAAYEVRIILPAVQTMSLWRCRPICGIIETWSHVARAEYGSTPTDMEHEPAVAFEQVCICTCIPRL